VANERSERSSEENRRVEVLIVGSNAPDTTDLLDALAHVGIEAARPREPGLVARLVVRDRPAVVVDMRSEDGVASRVLEWVCRTTSCNALVITDPTQVDCRLRTLERGAVHHLIAPFDVREALGRVQYLVATHAANATDRIEVGDLTIDGTQRCVVRNGTTVPLTPREIDVLVVLARSPNRPVSKQVMLREVWDGESRSENVVEANVSSLRRKLHALGPPVIHTVHRSGYVLRPIWPVNEGRARHDSRGPRPTRA
jgi:DNA-binding response OmpR family regulator